MSISPQEPHIDGGWHLPTDLLAANGHSFTQWNPLLREFGDSLPVLLWMSAADGRATLFNKHWLRFTGCTLERAQREGWLAHVHPDDAGPRAAALRTALAARVPRQIEYRLRRSDGQYRWMLDRAAPQFDAQGAFHGLAGVVIDITDRKRAEDQLRWLSKAVEQSPATVLITDLDGKIEYVNPKFTEVTGYTAAEVLGENPRILKSGYTAPQEYEKLWETIQTGEWRGEFLNKRKDGTLYWEAASISQIRDEQGRPTHYIGVKEDITGDKRLQEELQRSAERLRIAAESAGICVYDLDARSGEGRLDGADPFLSSLGNFDGWARAIHPDDRERVLEAIRRRRENGGPFYQEYRMVRPDGAVRYYSDHGAPECGGRWIGAIRDITAQKLAEEKLAWLAAVVESSSDAIVSANLQGIIQSWNPAAENLYGYTAAEMLGRPLASLSAPARRADAERRVGAVLQGETFLSFETVHMRKDSGVFPVSVVASPIKDPAGKVLGNSSIMRDITAEKHAQQALIESENRFRTLVQNNSDVITLINPNGIILYDSPGVSALLGVSPDERLGCEALRWVHPDDIPYLQMLHEEILREPGAKARAQFRLRHADGSWRWCDSWAVNLLQEPGVQALAACFRDITELKRVETALRESEQRYRKLIEDASDVIFTIDLNGNITSVNGIAERVSGYRRQELLGMNVREIAAPEYVATIRQTIEERLRGDAALPLEAELITRDGQRVAMEVSGRLQFSNGVPAGVLCIARDVSPRKRTERLEQNRREVLEMVAQNQPLESVLDRLEQMIELYYPGATTHISLAGGLAVPDRQPRPSSVAPGNVQGRLEVPILACDGPVLGVLQIVRPAPWNAVDSDRVLLDSMAKLASVALEHRQLTHRLAHQAQHDPLTGLPNRLLLEDRLRQAIVLARRQNSMVAVLYVDLDRFKLINDTLGHHVGDMLLKEAAKRMEGAVRESDTLARTGGDEFVAVLFGLETVRDAEMVAERIVEAMRSPFQVWGHELFASASVGLSLFPRDGEDAAALQQHADVAMYEAKSKGRNRFQKFVREMNSKSHERLEIENHLHRALEHGELLLHYQPQFRLPGAEFSGVEALLRWNHPKWGLLPPARFIPVAEESGLIIPMSLWVLEEACRQHQLWRRAGYPPVRIAANISAIQFMRSNLREEVARILAAHQVEPRYLELELTEGVLMRDVGDTARQLDELRALGVRISIDDFGTGYSSLSYLQRLPIDDLKIDKCFVRDISQTPGARAMVQAMIGLAHSLNMTATAEGVETEDQLEALRALGCDKVQGFLLARPAPADHWDAHWKTAGAPQAPVA